MRIRVIIVIQLMATIMPKTGKIVDFEDEIPWK